MESETGQETEVIYVSSFTIYQRHATALYCDVPMPAVRGASGWPELQTAPMHARASTCVRLE